MVELRPEDLEELVRELEENVVWTSRFPRRWRVVCCPVSPNLLKAKPSKTGIRQRVSRIET